MTEEDSSTQSKIDEIWKDDLLSRKDEARFLIDFLENRVRTRIDRGEVGSFVLNIDARWGDGKTFFLERFCKQLKEEKFLIAYVNAWRDDHTDDPLIAVLASISNALEPYLKKPEIASQFAKVKNNAGKVALAVGKGMFKTLSKKYIGDSLQDIVEGISDEDGSPVEELAKGALEGATKEFDAIADKVTESMISHFEKEASAIAAFKVNMSNLATSAAEETGINLPFFIVIDALDRCRPTYAIKLLERVKHMFETDNVVFVVATDTSQLRHSVRGAYGADFDGYAYLRRFFDRTFRFREVETSLFITQHMTRLELTRLSFPTREPEDVIKSAFKQFELSLRDAEQWFDIMETVILAWKYPTIKIEATLLTSLSAMYVKEGACSLDYKKALNGWSASQLVSTTQLYESDTGLKRIDRKLSLSNIFSSYKDSLSDSLSEISNKIMRSKTQSAKFDPESDYVADRIFDEHNARAGGGRNSPSVQAEILDLIRSAAQLS